MSNCFSKSHDIFSPIDFINTEPNSLHHGYIFNKNILLDEVVVSVFKAPNSFTGEDVIEISSHGGRLVFQKISNLLTELGSIHAEPGEFSKRAFLNGKIDLSQAEAIADLIRAKTELSYQSAKKQLSGSISNIVKSLREELINYCSLIELELDFSEEGLEIIDKQVLITKIDNITNNIEKLANTYSLGKIIKEGFNLAITGKPNVGKSSLFNYLLKDSRAIVSDIPGTTRDYLEEPLILGGFIFNLIDTAGIRSTDDSIEKMGVEKSFQKLDEADIIINVIDITSKNGYLPTNSEKIIDVYNKADLIASIPEDRLCISALTGLNIDSLEKLIVEKVRNHMKIDINTEEFITNERHHHLLLKSCEYLVNAKNLVENEAGNELISIEIREALNTLSEIIGKTTNVDILNNIFSKFCIGK